MADQPDIILHLVAADTSVEQQATLRLLLRGGETVGAAQHVVQVGSGRAVRLNGRAGRRLHVPAPFDLFRGALTGRELNRIAGGRATGVVVHAWSDLAAGWALPLLARGHAVLLEVGEQATSRRAMVWRTHGSLGEPLGLVSTNETTRQWLIGEGLAARRCVTVSRPVLRGSGELASRVDVRRALGLAATDAALLVLPPATRRSGAFVATWAALVARQVHRNIRIILPAGGADAGRVRRLVAACRHEHVLGEAIRDVTLPALLCGADLALHMPTGPAPAGGVRAAMCAGVPLVISDVPTMREWVDGQAGWYCKAGDVEDAARVIIRALDAPEESAARADAAREVSGGFASDESILAGYAGIYRRLRNLAGSGLSLAEGLDDVALPG